jgi:Carboxypeptidase regulatory-like domain
MTIQAKRLVPSLLRSFRRKVLGIVFVWALPLLGQYTTATLGGTVHDPSGAVVPGAMVTALNVATNFAQTFTTSDTGEFLFPRLPVGNYNLEVEKPGFGGYVQSGIVLTVNETTTQDVTLTVGATAQQVRVSANATMVATSTATLSAVVNNTQINELPLNTRYVQALVFLPAGSTNVTSHYCGFGCIGGAFPQEQYADINGTIAGSVNYQLDGADFNDYIIGANFPFPAPDAIEEFNLQTSNMSAAYGNAAGGVVNIVTKSGTNEIHGAGFEFLRNGPIFDARNYFATKVDEEKQNQFGGVIGGPIKKDRLFYFGSYQGTRLRTAPQGQITFVPTLAERSGDFSDLLPAHQLKNPVTGVAYAGNQIPVSPVSKAFLAYIPLPNGPGEQLTYTGSATIQNADEVLAKIDYQQGKHHVSGHYYLTRFSQPPVGVSGNSLLVAKIGSLLKLQNIAATDTYTLRNNLLLNTWYSLDHYSQWEDGLTPPINFPAAGINIAANPNTPSMTLSVGGGFGFNNGFYGASVHDVNTASESVIWVKGSHELQFGGSLIFLHSPKGTDYQTGGSFSFSSALSGNNIADYILGEAGSFTQGGGQFYDFNRTGWNIFVQDDWHASSNLTLNLGLRWQPFVPYRDGEQRLACFEPGTQSVRYPNAPAGLLFNGDAGCPNGSMQNSLLKLDPRIGFAYRLTRDGNTSVRGGFGLYSYTPAMVPWQNAAAIPPFAPTFTLTAVSFANPWGSAGIANPFPASFGPLNPGPTATFKTPISISRVFPQNFQSPQYATWNLTIERQLGKNWLIRGAYMGNEGSHLSGDGDEEQGEQQVNPAIYVPGHSTTANTQARRMYQNFGPVGMVTSATTSNYQALAMTAESRSSHGLTLLASYVWSKSLNSFAPLGASGSNTDPFDRQFDYGLSDNDLPYVFKFTPVYSVPESHTNRFASLLTSGWYLSSILTWQSGFPFSIFSGKDNSLSGVGNDRADLAAGTSLQQAGLDPNRPHSQLIQQYFNTSAFTTNKIGTFGNTGKNILRGPGFFDTDLALRKNTRLTERFSLQFRVEAFNAFNTVSFNNPGQIVGTSSFGKITSQAGNPRILQISGKIIF